MGCGLVVMITPMAHGRPKAEVCPHTSGFPWAKMCRLVFSKAPEPQQKIESHACLRCSTILRTSNRRKPGRTDGFHNTYTRRRVVANHFVHFRKDGVRMPVH